MGKMQSSDVSSYQEIEKIIIDSRHAAESSRSEVPRGLAVFPLPINYFKEDPDKLYQLREVSFEVDIFCAKMFLVIKHFFKSLF